MHCRTSSSIPGLYALEASGNPSPVRQPRTFQTFSTILWGQGQNQPWLRNHCVMESFVFFFFTYSTHTYRSSQTSTPWDHSRSWDMAVNKTVLSPCCHGVCISGREKRARRSPKASERRRCLSTNCSLRSAAWKSNKARSLPGGWGQGKLDV